MAVVLGCGFIAGLIYYKRTTILRGVLTKYSDYKECLIKEQKEQEEQIYKQTPKEKLISCKYYEFIPSEFNYDRTTQRRITSSKICKLKFKNKIFYSFVKNYNLRDTYLEYIDNLDNENNEVITHLNKITNSIPQLLSATATIKIKSHNMDLIPEFDICEFINKFSFNNNSLYLTDVNKIYIMSLLNTEYNLNLDLNLFYLDGNIENVEPDNLDIEVLYQLITNDAEIYSGTNVVLNFDEYNNLKVTTKFKDL